MILGAKKYLLRWRFDFANSPTRMGMWNSTGPSQHGAQMAWSTNKENMVLAQIEGKDIYTNETKTLVACEGHNFVNMKWYAAISCGSFNRGQYPGQIIGLILQTREQDVLYLVDGRYGVKNRTEQDKNFNYAGFGK